MKTRSFISLFDSGEIANIEIPRIQRDYAQGRQDSVVTRIRQTFLSVLHQALISGDPVSLDFVYGEVTGGTMTPLDGQQRLTTLFLLHWYIAARAGVNRYDSDVLTRFTYETRYSSRDFCAKLAEQRPDFPIDRLSEWIRDQSWFFGAWRHDPTIQSMLVVLDDIHALFRDSDSRAVWQRLVDRVAPAIVFHVLPIADMGLTDDLYIKMNSRGKPLTTFEQFKANFEKTIRDSSPHHYREFTHKIDNDWADLLWPLRGDDDVIDDEFMRYLRFVTDVLIHRSAMKIPPDVLDKDIDRGAAVVYGGENPDSDSNRRFLFDALDCWAGTEIGLFFEGVFTKEGWQPGKVAIHDSVNLFNACCEQYGIMDGRSRRFSLPRTLMLYAVLVHRIQRTQDFSRRIRTLRNLVFASDNEIRLESFPTLLASTSALMKTGSLSMVEGYNRKQIDEEIAKGSFLSAHAEFEEALFRLEDHSLTRGCAAAFELDEVSLARRVGAFFEAFSEDGAVPLLEVSAALLACGDYSQKKSRNTFQLGSWRRREVWRDLLTGTAKADFGNTCGALTRMLDALGEAADRPVSERLRRIVDRYLNERQKESRFDWRYYLVKYDKMREGDSGLYVGPDDGTKGFDLCMMYKERMNSNYRDPYLYAIFAYSAAVTTQDVEEPWHTGYHTTERWLTLRKSGARLRCRSEGFVLGPPHDETYREAFDEVLAKHGVDATLTLRIPQVSIDGVLYDTLDRVQSGAALVRGLLAMQGG